MLESWLVSWFGGNGYKTLESTLNTKPKPWDSGLLPDDGSREFGATDTSRSK